MENCVLALFISFIISTFSLSTGATFITGMEIYKGQGDSGLVIGDSYYEFYQPKDSKTPYKKPTEGAISFEGAWYVPYVPPVPTEEALKREKKEEKKWSKKNFEKHVNNRPSQKTLELHSRLCDIAEKDYKCEHFSNRDEWTDKVFEGINDDKPSILNVSISNTASLPYNMPDHIVAVTGYSETGNYKVKVLDTFVPGFENRWYDLTTIYEVNRKHKNGMIKR